MEDPSVSTSKLRKRLGRNSRAVDAYSSRMYLALAVGKGAEIPLGEHLYVALACPWASRTMMVRKLKRLDDPHHGINCRAAIDRPGVALWRLSRGGSRYDQRRDIFARNLQAC